MTGLHHLVTMAYWILNKYAMCSIWWRSQTFWIHVLYEGGGVGFSHLIVTYIHFNAAVSQIFKRYFLDLPFRPLGITPNRAIVGSQGISCWKISFLHRMSVVWDITQHDDLDAWWLFTTTINTSRQTWDWSSKQIHQALVDILILCFVV